MHTIPQFRVFLSSPGDVSQERDDAQAVIHEINESGEFANLFVLKLFRWDDKSVVIPMTATDIPQKSVDVYMTRPSACDLVVCIFWSRMGSPLVMDKREYLSGTHYEYNEALEGYQQVGKPMVWLYRCAEDPIISLKDPKRSEKNQQFDLVEQFFAQFQDAEGRYTGGVNAYPTHADFKALYKSQLLTYLRHLRDNPTPTPEPPPASTPYSGEPYRGLLALRQSDAPIFFGRERETLDVQTLVQREPFTIIVGASGSGKSSLAAAGVCANLHKQGWQIVRMVPGSRPFFNLTLALLLQALHADPADVIERAESEALRLRQHPDSLAALLRGVDADKVLLLVDQLEELFTLADADEARDFATLINTMPMKGLATLRADFYEKAIPHFEQPLRKAYSLGRPSLYGLLQMVTRPSEMVGIVWEAGLAQRILEDAGNEPGALALVAYVLQALYLRNPKHFHHADYEAFGGVHGAIGHRAESVYQGLAGNDEAKAALLQRVFRELVTVDERGTATRQRAPLSKFSADALMVIRAFTDARLLVTDENAVEVAHEAIFRSWAWLKDWIAEAQEDLILLRQVRNAVHDWQARHRPDYLLWPQERLTLVYAMQARLNPELNEIEQDFIEPEQERLYREIAILTTDHKRRRWIGERLATIGDPRTGIGLDERGLPQIDWLLARGSSESVVIKTDEREIGPVNIPDFYIAKYLITYRQFQAFLDAPDGFKDDRWWQGFPDSHIKQWMSTAVAQYDNYPRDSVSWYQAVAFTRWLDAKYREHGLFEVLLPQGEGLRMRASDWQVRLPTEWEWQWAAQNGTQSRKYPWGDWDTHPRANTTEAGIGDRSTAVGMYPHGAASCGALDMSGNLWEWCLNDYESPDIITGFGNGERKVLRGGSFVRIRVLPLRRPATTTILTSMTALMVCGWCCLPLWRLCPLVLWALKASETSVSEALGARSAPL